MRVTLTPVEAGLSGRVPVDLYARIKAQLTYARSTYGWVPHLRKKGWSSVTVCLAEADARGLWFPAGLWPRVAPLILPHLDGPPAEGFLATPWWAHLTEEQDAGLFPPEPPA